MLELIQQKYLSILMGTGRNNFIVEWNTAREDENSAPPAEPLSDDELAQ